MATYRVYAWGGDDIQGWEIPCRSKRQAVLTAASRAVRMSFQRDFQSTAPYVTASGPDLKLRIDVMKGRVSLPDGRMNRTLRDLLDECIGEGKDAHPQEQRKKSAA